MKRLLLVLSLSLALLGTLGITSEETRAGDAGDTAVFSGDFSDYVFAYEPGLGLVVTDTVNGDGTVFLQGASVLRFADATVSVIDGAAGPATAASDVILDGPGDGRIEALGGDDVILSVGGNDLVNGGPGFDVVVIRGRAVDFTARADAQGAVALTGPGWSAQATGIEELQFDDRTVAVDSLASTERPRAVAAVVQEIDPFDDPDLSDWVTDRYEPAAFETTLTLGDNRLHVGIAASDVQTSSALNFQGRLKSLGVDNDNKAGTYATGDLYVGADWAAATRHASIWVEVREPNGGAPLKIFPALGFTSDGGTSNSFAHWNHFTGAWAPLGIPPGFAYGNWYTLQIHLIDGSVGFYVDGDLQTTLSLPGAFTEDAYIAAVYLQAFNYSEDYDVFWDNVGTGVIPNPDPSSTWVDFAYAGAVERGTTDQPFNTLAEGVAAVTSGGTVKIKGDTATNSTTETPRITKAMRIEAIGGAVRIGAAGG